MKKIKLLIQFLKILFSNEKNEGFATKHSFPDNHFTIYSISTNDEIFTFLISRSINKKHEVLNVKLTEKEVLSLGIINEKILLKACKTKILIP